MKDKVPMTHVFRGRRYIVSSTKPRRIRGWCDDPINQDKTVNIPVEGHSKDNLITIIHEGLHACLWDTSEDAVEETSDSIADLLWRLGWRKVKFPLP